MKRDAATGKEVDTVSHKYTHTYPLTRTTEIEIPRCSDRNREKGKNRERVIIRQRKSGRNGVIVIETRATGNRGQKREVRKKSN